MVKASADSLLTIINDVLDFSKIEAGKLDLEEVEFGLRQTLDDMMAILALRAHQKGLELACHVLPDVPEFLLGDPSRLRQVLINLTGNAIKFTERGEVVIEVSISESDTRGNAGDLGSPACDLSRLARCTCRSGQEVGSRKSSTRSSKPSLKPMSKTLAGGTGLGLTITSRLVQMMGGQIWLEVLWIGGTFHFTARLKVQNIVNPQRSPLKL